MLVTTNGDGWHTKNVGIRIMPDKPDKHWNWPMWDPRDFGPYDAENYRAPVRWQTIACGVLLLLVLFVACYIWWYGG